MSWRDRVSEALEGENTRNARHSGDASGPFVPNVPSVPANPSTLLRDWERGLLLVEPDRPPAGWDGRVWWQLWSDACWLFGCHGEYAALNEWNSLSLFGVSVGDAPAGGLCQQLRSSRQLVFDGPRAIYRLWGVSSPVNALAARGLPTMWEVCHD